MKKYKNENGFSLVQVLIGLGLTGMLSVAVMNQMSNQNASSKRAERKIELDNFLNNIAKTLAKKDVCNYNFAHPDRNTLGNSAHSTLYANTAGKVLAKAGSSYLSDSVKITSISTSEVEDSSTEFKVVIKADRKKDQKNKNAYTTIKREIRISADMDGTTVNSCYFKLDSISDIQENENIDIADFCQGEGVVTEGSDGEKKCIFKAASLEDEHAKCKAGYSLRSLIYNPSTYYYEGTCEQNYTGSCSEIGDVDDSGNFTCLDIDSLYHSDQKVVLETGKELKLSVVGGKIQLNGGAGSSSGSSKVNGICDESVEYTCKTGALNKGIYISNTTQHRWSCDGKGGGSNSGLCSKDKSNYSWSEEPWGSCSGVPSTQTRIVRCVNANGITQNDSKCSESKPQETQTCSGTCPPKSFTLHGNPRILKDGRIGDKRLIKVEITPSGDPKKDLSCQVGNGSVPATAITYSFECRSNSQWALVNTKPQCDGNTGNT
jgi:Tfp pilus assembly protein PilV